jgi:hypothetical protein
MPQREARFQGPEPLSSSSPRCSQPPLEASEFTGVCGVIKAHHLRVLSFAMLRYAAL